MRFLVPSGSCYFYKHFNGRYDFYQRFQVKTRSRLNGLLAPLELPVQSLHANLQQRQRLKHLDRFKSNSNGILISTDVAARGLDIPNVEMIIHFQVIKSLKKIAEGYFMVLWYFMVFCSSRKQQNHMFIDLVVVRAVEHPEKQLYYSVVLIILLIRKY